MILEVFETNVKSTLHLSIKAHGHKWYCTKMLKLLLKLFLRYGGYLAEYAFSWRLNGKPISHAWALLRRFWQTVVWHSWIKSGEFRTGGGGGAVGSDHCIISVLEFWWPFLLCICISSLEQLGVWFLQQCWDLITAIKEKNTIALWFYGGDIHQFTTVLCMNCEQWHFKVNGITS